MNRPEKVETFGASRSASVTTPGFAAAFERWRPFVLSLLRIMAGLLFLEHGTAKLFGFPPHGAIPVYPNIEWFAGRIELIGGALVALGLYTRPIAFLLSGEMAIGYFADHAPRSFFPLLNGGESAILFCFVFFYLVFAGGGPLSLDKLISGKGGRP
ncbi:MAG TPA: DoxX family protein [Xanthobacteraceae bacterium]|nr:DoxX family protein [Xanthobacteraceae bacterium]